MSRDLRALIMVALTAAIAAVAWLEVGSNGDLAPHDISADAPVAKNAPPPGPIAALTQAVGARTWLAAGSDAPIPARAPAAARLLRGRVLDIGDRPVAGARIWVDDRSSRNAPEPRDAGTTRDDGSFELSFDATVPPPLSISVRAAAHAPFEHEFAPTSEATDVGDLRLLEGGRLVGTVVANHGATLGGVEVVLVPVGPGVLSRARDRATLLTPIAPDARGAFAFEHVPPGPFRAAASGPRHAAAETADVVLVEDGRVVDVGLLEVEPATTVRGVVRAPDRRPVANAMVRLAASDRPTTGGHFGARTDADGRFEIAHVPLRRAELEASASGYVTTTTPPFDPGSIGELQVWLGEGAAIVGRVVDERSGAAIELFALRAVRVGSPRRTPFDADLETRTSVGLGGETTRGASGPLRVPSDFARASTHASGAFRCEGLDAGIYVVEVAAPGHVFTRSAPLEVVAGAGPVDCSIALRPGLRASGSVVTSDGGRPIVGARVELRSAVASTGRAGPPIDTALTDARGRFAFDGIAAAEYELAARHPDFADAGLALRHIDADVEFPPLVMPVPARLHGSVRDFQRSIDLRAQVLAFGGAGRLRFATVDDAGGYELRGLEPGGYVVRAFVGDAHRFLLESASLFTTKDGAPDAPDLRLGWGEDRALDLALTRTRRGSVTGLVRENGLPLAGATIVLGLLAQTTTDRSGRFTLGDLPVGPAELSVRGPGAAFDALRQTVVVDAGTTAVDLVFATGSLRGTIDDAGAAGGDGGADAAASLAGTAVLFAGVTQAPASLADHRRAGGRFVSMTVRAGRFAADHVPAGPALLRVQLRGRAMVEVQIEIPVAGIATPTLRAR